MRKATWTCAGPMTSRTSSAAPSAVRSRRTGHSSSRPMKDAASSTGFRPTRSLFPLRQSAREISRRRRSPELLTDDLVAQILNARPGCVSSAFRCRRHRYRSGADHYSDIFPTNQIPTACFDPAAAAIMHQCRAQACHMPNSGTITTFPRHSQRGFPRKPVHVKARSSHQR